jgi:uncharacterized protein (DUF2126 family)
VADEATPSGARAEDGERLLVAVAEHLGARSDTVFPAYEDAAYALWREILSNASASGASSRRASAP